MARQPRAAAPARPPRAAPREAWLLFIDTNILLDFYRLGGESAERQLKLLEKHRASLILTDQVWMEFLKNRQKVIIDTIKSIKKPDKISFPPIIAAYQQAKMAGKHVEAAIKSHAQVRKRIEGILRDPSHNDHVYIALKKLFEGEDRYVISDDHKSYAVIRNLARKRFVMGYPPRKDSDNSIGDAVNWEWIVHCANESDDHHNVMIVSRDTDYGVTLGDEGYINDWLKREFKRRISRKRKIALTQKLTTGLKKLDEVVPVEDVAEEERVINTIELSQIPSGGRWGTVDTRQFNDSIRAIRDQLRSFETFEYPRFVMPSQTPTKPDDLA